MVDNSHNDGNYDTLLLIIRNIFEERLYFPIVIYFADLNFTSWFYFWKLHNDV